MYGPRTADATIPSPKPAAAVASLRSLFIFVLFLQMFVLVIFRFCFRVVLLVGRAQYWIIARRRRRRTAECVDQRRNVYVVVQ